MESRSEDDVILQFVSCTFLHLQSTVSTKLNGRSHARGPRNRSQQMEKPRKTTDPQLASCVRFHNLSHVMHQLGERVSDLPMLDYKALRSIVRCSGYGLDMCAMFSFASHLSESVGDKSEVWDPQAQVFSITLPIAKIGNFTVSLTSVYGRSHRSSKRDIYSRRGILSVRDSKKESKAKGSIHSRDRRR